MKKKNKIFITSTLSLLGAGAILLGGALNIQAESTIPARQLSNIASIVKSLNTTTTNEIKPTVVEETTPVQPTIYCPQGHENCDGQHSTLCPQGHENCDGLHTALCTQNHENCDGTHARRNQGAGTPNCDGSGRQHANGNHHGNRS